MKYRTLSIYAAAFLLTFSLFIVSCTEEDGQISDTKLVAGYPAEASLKWNQLYLEIERYASGYRPGPAARALGLMGLACYEACVTGMPGYNSLEAHFNGLQIPNADAGQKYHWPTVIHGVYSVMMPEFFTEAPPAGVKNSWDVLVNELNQKYLDEAGSEVYNLSIKYGESVGLAVWEWSKTDPYGHEAYKNPFGNYSTSESYDWSAHYDGPGDWQPTVPGPTSPMGPYFGKARTFVLKDSEKICYPPSHYYMEYSEDPHSEYYAQALQVYTKNAETDFQIKWIGEFWSDDLLNLTFSSGPRWVAITNQVILNEDANLEIALEAYAKVGMCVNDAAVGAWASKYHYNVERPATYIQKIIDTAYTSNLNNPLTGEIGFVPAYPAFPSGHSTMGGACAEALASIFGYSYGMTDNCHLGRTEFEGTPRTFPSFNEMADENAWSRVLLGVNWNMDCIEGVRFGTYIARKIHALPWKK